MNFLCPLYVLKMFPLLIVDENILFADTLPLFMTWLFKLFKLYQFSQKNVVLFMHFSVNHEELNLM